MLGATPFHRQLVTLRRALWWLKFTAMSLACACGARNGVWPVRAPPGSGVTLLPV